MLSKLFTASAVFFLIAACIVLGFSDNDALITKEVADLVNMKAKSWTASHEQGLMTGATTRQIKTLCGVKRTPAPKKLPRKNFDTKLEMPTSFEAAEKWPQCPTITKIWDQSACGSCWSFSVASSASDRMCINGIDNNITFSPAQIMECCWMCGSGCNGGQPESAYEYLNYNGGVTQKCQPYPFASCAHHVKEANHPPCPTSDEPTPACPGNVCTNNKTTVEFKKYFFEQAYSIAGEQQYMQELLTNGPFAVAFSVYGDFPVYKGGVYRHTSGQYLGGHAVRVVGWGELNGDKYWKIANSWNNGWGMAGYFLIARGVNECGIEESGAAGVPKKN